MLALINLTIGHNNSPLINSINISFSGIDRKRIALLGTNGSGKTTLLETIMGRIEPITGTVQVHKERIELIEQTASIQDNMLVGEYLESFLEHEWEWYKIEKVLMDIGFTGDKQLQTMSSLSGGERMRIQFAVSLLQEPTILLLDEPTNHLDTDGIKWLLNFIKQYNGSIIYTSHSREFLINTATDIWHIEPHTNDLYAFKGGYYAFLQDKEHRYKKLEDTIMKLDKEIDERILWLKQYEFHPKYRFSDIVMSSKKKLAELEKQRDSMILPLQYSIKLPQTPSKNKKTSLLMNIKIDNMSYGSDKTIPYNIDKKVYYGDRIAIQGANGSGKTTLLKALMGDIHIALDGRIDMINTVQMGYLGQHTNYPTGIKVMDYIASQTMVDTTQMYSALHKMGLKQHIDKRLESLSGGQKRRLELLIIALSRPQILFLDEPTNHIDIDTQEEIIRYIQCFTGVVIVISHDTLFLQDIGIDEIWHIGS